VTVTVPARILIADDNRDNIFVLQNLLAHQGHHVTVARDGSEAVAAAMREPFDILLLDIDMPVMDGWEVCRRLRAAPQLHGLQIIAMSAHALIGDHEHALQVGLDDFIAKPFSPRDVVAKVNRILEGVAARREKHLQ
jgi:CheY-like chemotaxis protein